MKKILVLVLVALMVLPAAALADEVVNVFNWYDYIDESVFEQFTEETGIKVNAMYFTTNEEMIGGSQPRRVRRMLPLGVYR